MRRGRRAVAGTTRHPGVAFEVGAGRSSRAPSTCRSASTRPRRHRRTRGTRRGGSSARARNVEGDARRERRRGRPGATSRSERRRAPSLVTRGPASPGCRSSSTCSCHAAQRRRAVGAQGVDGHVGEVVGPGRRRGALEPPSPQAQRPTVERRDRAGWPSRAAGPGSRCRSGVAAFHDGTSSVNGTGAGPGRGPARGLPGPAAAATSRRPASDHQLRRRRPTARVGCPASKPPRAVPAE